MRTTVAALDLPSCLYATVRVWLDNDIQPHDRLTMLVQWSWQGWMESSGRDSHGNPYMPSKGPEETRLLELDVHWMAELPEGAGPYMLCQGGGAGDQRKGASIVVADVRGIGDAVDDFMSGLPDTLIEGRQGTPERSHLFDLLVPRAAAEKSGRWRALNTPATVA